MLSQNIYEDYQTRIDIAIIALNIYCTHIFLNIVLFAANMCFCCNTTQVFQFLPKSVKNLNSCPQGAGIFDSISGGILRQTAFYSPLPLGAIWHAFYLQEWQNLPLSSSPRLLINQTVASNFGEYSSMLLYIHICDIFIYMWYTILWYPMLSPSYVCYKT